MSAPLTYGIAAKAKNADCAARSSNWVATNEKARQIDVTVGGSNPGGPPDLPVPPAAAGSVTNETLAAGADVAKDNGAMDFIANATGLDLRPGLDARAPEDGRRQAGCRRSAEGGPGRVPEGTQPLSSRRRRSHAERRRCHQHLHSDARRRAEPADPLDQGIRRQTIVGWLFVLPALVMYGLFVLQPLALTVQYSLYRWDGVGPATWVGLSNYAAVLSEPKLVETLFNAFRLVLFFSLIPVALGLVTASVIHRVAAGRLGTVSRTVLFLPAGHPAGRRRDHLGPAAVPERV